MTLAELARELAEAGARDEALGEYVEPRRVLGVPRAPRIVPVGRAWRLGDILLTPEGQALRVGTAVRAIMPKDFESDKTVAGESRRALRLAAIRGGVREGDVVNVGWVRIEGALADAIDESALRERAALLIEQARMR